MEANSVGESDAAPRGRVLFPAFVLGAIGFGIGLLMTVVSVGEMRGWRLSFPALAMAGLGAGTGAGLGADRGGAFRLGVVGAVVGAAVGLLLGLFGAGLAATFVAAVLVTTGLAIAARTTA